MRRCKARLTEMTLLMCISAIWAQILCFFTRVSSGAPLGVAAASDCLMVGIRPPSWVPLGLTINGVAVMLVLDGYNILCLLIWQVIFFRSRLHIYVYIYTQYIYYATRIVYFIYYAFLILLLLFSFCEKESWDPNSLRNLCHVTMLQLTSLWTRFIHVTVWCRNKNNLCSLDAENVFWSSDLSSSPSILSLKQRIRYQAVTRNDQKVGSSRNNEREPKALGDEPTG